MVELATLVGLLREESAVLDAMVSGSDEHRWSASTPAVGWTVAHQIAHLQWTDTVSRLAVEDRTAFMVLRRELQGDPGRVHRAADEGSRVGPAQLLARWRAERDGLAAALAACPPSDRIAWIGPDMSPVSMARARLMETWAHGQDVADALGVGHDSADEVLHQIAHLGVRTRAFSFRNRGLTPPAGEVVVELAGPHGQVWRWGVDDAGAAAEDTVTGQALEFCLAVTQRRSLDELHLIVRGPAARQWMSIAQTFAGPPTHRRAPGR